MRHLFALLSLFTVANAAADDNNLLSTNGKVDVRLSVIDCGRIDINQPQIFNPNTTSTTPIKAVNSCYLISHPKGTLIWDAGLSDELQKQKNGLTINDGAFHLSMPITMASQLEMLNIVPSQVDYIALSHLHFDHTGNANLFNNAKWLVQENEYKVAFAGEESKKLAFEVNDYQSLKNKALTIKGDHQVFGDGSVVLLAAYGHTPGHQVLYIDLPSYGPVILSGDLYHTTENFQQKAIPVFNDKSLTQAAFKRIDKIMVQTGAKLWIGHEASEFKQRKLAPYWYR